MTLTIGIINYNTKRDLEEAINSIWKNSPSCDYQIVVVDNNSKDGSKKFLKHIENDKIKCILNDKNIGFGAACNQVFRIQNTPYVLFMNSDVKVSKNTIDRMVDFLKKKRKAGVVTGKLLFSDGTIQLSCRKFPTIIRALFGRESLLRKFFPNNPISKEYLTANLDYNKIQFPDWVRGAVMLFRSEVFKKVGGFDEKFFLYLEDTDICLRLRKKGYEVVYFPDAVFYHKLGSSAKKEKIRTKIIHNISMFYYLRKNMNYNFFVLSLIFIALLIRIASLLIISSSLGIVT